MTGEMATTFEPSINLAIESQSLVAFMREVHQDARLADDDVIKNAVRRYECLWLPLLASHTDLDLEPPLDVHWVWHVHMLSPVKYRSDCDKTVSHVPDHRLRILRSDRNDAADRARNMWELSYPGEPYDVPDPESKQLANSGQHQSKLSYDLLSAVKRQLAFYYHVSLPHHTDQRFLEDAICRYQKFVTLKKKHPDAFLVPMYDIDLVWHAHQIHPNAYNKDTTAFLGYLLNHDDTVTERQGGAVLVASDVLTRQYWSEMYDEPLVKPGTMHRGRAPHGNLNIMSDAEKFDPAPKGCELRLDRVELTGGQGHRKVKGHMAIIGYCVGEKKGHVVLPSRKYPFEWTSASPKGLVTCLVHSNKDYYLNVSFTRKDTIKGSIVGGDELCKFYMRPDKVLRSLPSVREGQTVELMYASPSGLTATVQCTAGRVWRVDETVRVEKAAFSDVVMPTQGDDTWGPISLPPLPPKVSNVCSIATHRVKNDKGDIAFTVRVLHSLPLRMSMVQVFHKSHMTAVSHLIGPEQLPPLHQVSLRRECICLDQRVGERAMLIKGDYGDWGVVKGSWAGVSGSQPPQENGTERAPVADSSADQGYLQAYFYPLAEPFRPQTCSVLKRESSKSQYRSHVFCLAGIEVSLDMGSIKVLGSTQYVAENVALAFSVPILFCMCDPMQYTVSLSSQKPQTHAGSLSKVSLEVPKIVSGGQAVTQDMDAQKSPSEGVQQNARYDLRDMELFACAGYGCKMASNSWVYSLTRQPNGTGVDSGLADACPVTTSGPEENAQDGNYVNNNTFAAEYNGQTNTGELVGGMQVADSSDFSPWEPDGVGVGNGSLWGSGLVNIAGCGGCGTVGGEDGSSMAGCGANCGSVGAGGEASDCGDGAACGASSSCGGGSLHGSD